MKSIINHSGKKNRHRAVVLTTMKQLGNTQKQRWKETTDKMINELHSFKSVHGMQPNHLDWNTKQWIWQNLKKKVHLDRWSGMVSRDSITWRNKPRLMIPAPRAITTQQPIALPMIIVARCKLVKQIVSALLNKTLRKIFLLDLRNTQVVSKFSTNFPSHQAFQGNAYDLRY